MIRPLALLSHMYEWHMVGTTLAQLVTWRRCHVELEALPDMTWPLSAKFGGDAFSSKFSRKIANWCRSIHQFNFPTKSNREIACCTSVLLFSELFSFILWNSSFIHFSLSVWKIGTRRFLMWRLQLAVKASKKVAIMPVLFIRLRSPDSLPDFFSKF